MKKIDNNELLSIIGGWNLSGTIINAFVGAGKFIYGMGQAFGSSIRRISANKLCPLR